MNYLFNYSNEACGFGYHVARYDGQAEEHVIYRGEDTDEVFHNNLEYEECNINDIFAHLKSLTTTKQNTKDYKDTPQFWKCKQELGKNITNRTVRDHFHFTCEYIGVTHKPCRFKLRIKPGKTNIPVVFHILKGYDRHLIMQKYALKTVSLHAWPKMQKTPTSHSSLDNSSFKPVFRLKKVEDTTDKSDFRITKLEFGDKTDILLRKGV